MMEHISKPVGRVMEQLFGGHPCPAPQPRQRPLDDDDDDLFAPMEDLS
ncbi:hypothetical protein [Teichococcus deserti]|nr:hypothetical protein [Pseudoroseomonas deserti]